MTIMSRGSRRNDKRDDKRDLALALVARAAQSSVAGALNVAGSQSGRSASGFGTLALTALSISLLDEAKAADPDVTILDDDKISYKDLAHGVFELTTKEAIPRHIIVDDPGQTVALNKNGSSVGVSQFDNSAARMEELQQAQQEVLANYAKGFGTTGSGTPDFTKSLPLEPINFVPADSPMPLNSLTPLPVAPIPLIVVPIIRPLPIPPTLNTGAGPIEVDTIVFDTFTPTRGTFTASSSSGAILTFGISGGTPGVTQLGGVTYDVSKQGPFGTLYVDSATGDYTFIPDNAAINALKNPTTQSFVITVTDGTSEVDQTFSIGIDGANDAATIFGTVTGSLNAAPAAAAPLGAVSVSGLLTNTDVDDPGNTFTTVTTATPSNGGYGTFTMTAGGLWTYVLDSSNNAVRALNVGDTLIDTFTVTSIDGTPELITITIGGTNDAAVISGVATGSVTEAAYANPGDPTATGKLFDTDVDNPSNSFVAVTDPKPSAGGYGHFTMTADGVWTYTLNNDNHAVQALNVGGTLTDTFIVTTIDGTPQLVTITIHGTNDPAVISGSTTGSVTEAACANPGDPTATGKLFDTDVDNPSNSFVAVTDPKPSAGGYGHFTMTADGVWTYTLNNDNHAVQALNVGGTLTDTFTVTTIDGTPQLVTITIHGTNDPAVISGSITGSVTEPDCQDDGKTTATGQLMDIDVDNPPNTFTAVNSPTRSTGGFGTFTMTAAGVWTYTLDTTNCAVESLRSCDTLIDTFKVTTIDGTEQVITIKIHGADDHEGFDPVRIATPSTTEPQPASTTDHSDASAAALATGKTADASAHVSANSSDQSSAEAGNSHQDNSRQESGQESGQKSGQELGHGKTGTDDSANTFASSHGVGEGHGDDRFMFASLSDHHAARSDVMSTLRSGADRLDLTALGALGFVVLALDPSSTTVPAHTIAWLYDSSANQTVVYVNSTNHTLSISDSGLVEIHLAGIATIQHADSHLAPETSGAILATDPVHLDSAVEAKATGCTTTAAESSSSHSGDVHVIVLDGNAGDEATDHGRSTCGTGYENAAASERVPPTHSGTETQPVRATGDNAPASPSSAPSLTPHLDVVVPSQDKVGSTWTPTFGSATPAPIVAANTVLSKDANLIPSLSHDDNWQIRPDIVSIAASHPDVQAPARHSDVPGFDPIPPGNSFHFKPADPQPDTSDLWGPTAPMHNAASGHHGGDTWGHRGPGTAHDPSGHDAVDIIGVPRGHGGDAHAHDLIA